MKMKAFRMDAEIMKISPSEMHHRNQLNHPCDQQGTHKSYEQSSSFTPDLNLHESQMSTKAHVPSTPGLHEPKYTASKINVLLAHQ